MIKNSIMIIDNHAHIYNEKIYQDYCKKIGTKDFIAFVMAVSNINNSQLLKFIKTKKNLCMLATVDTEKNIAKQLIKIDQLFKKKEIIGIKLYPGYYYFYPSDKIVEPIAKLCLKYDKPLVIHSGDVYNIEGDAMLKYTHPIHIDELAVKFPKCKIIISHFGIPYFKTTANVVFKNSNVYTDISGIIFDTRNKKETLEMANICVKDLKDVIAYFPSIKNKIMFGTDYSGENTPINQVSPYIKIAKKLFAGELQKNCFYKLAEKLYLE